jgi:FlaA1/EpsC-like NDP-sugar epimerase
LIAVVLIGLNVNGAYRAGIARRDVRRISLSALLAVAILGAVTLLPPRAAIPLPFLMVFGLASILTLTIERYLVELGIRQAYAHGIGLRKAVIVGRKAEVDEIIAGLRTDQNLDQRVVGYVTPAQIHDALSLGTVDQIESILDREDPAELIIAELRHAASRG